MMVFGRLPRRNYIFSRYVIVSVNIKGSNTRVYLVRRSKEGGISRHQGYYANLPRNCIPAVRIFAVREKYQ